MQVMLELMLRSYMVDFPGVTVVKNPPANAGDTGSITGPGRSHKPESTKPVPHNYQVCLPKACAPQQESSPHWPN